MLLTICKLQALVLVVCTIGIPIPVLSQSISPNSISNQLETAQTDSQKIDLLVEISATALEQGKVDSARQILRRAQKLSDSLDFTYGRQNALYGYGNFYLVQQQYDSAEVVLSRAMEMNPDTPLSTKIQNLLATAYRYQGNNQLAIELYREVLASIDTTARRRTAAGVSQNMADAYMNLGNSAEAFKNYHKAVAYGESAQDSLFLATALNNLGNAYNSEDMHEDAGPYLERSLEISRAIGFAPGQLRAMVNLANTRSSQSRFDEAESLYKQALAISEKIRPDSPPIQIQYNLGEMYFRMENLEQAEAYYSRSLEQSKAVGIPQGIYFNASGLGNVAAERDNLQLAIEWNEQALDVAEKMQNPAMSQQRHHRLYELRKQQDSLRLALLHLEQSKALSDSLRTREQSRMIAEYQTRLDLEQKEQQNRELQAESIRQTARIELQFWLLAGGALVLIIIGIFAVLLYRANSEKKAINQRLEAQKRELEEANELKNKLFSIVAHDLRTPLSALIGMLDLLRDEALTPKEIRGISAELDLSLRHNVNIMENLLSWSKQQMSGMSVDIEELDPHAIAEEIVEAYKFNARHKKVVLKNKINPDLNVRADYDMLKLVLRNLVSNGIKFSEAGDEVIIDAEFQDGVVRFEVSDTGIGIPEDLQQKIFKTITESRSGTKNESGSGIGLHLCKQFIEAQEGGMDFDSTPGKGSRFYFTLPGVSEVEHVS